MDGTQVIQIRSLLLEAADAIDRANAIVSTLDSDDQTLLATPLRRDIVRPAFRAAAKTPSPLPRACRGRRRPGRRHGM